MEFRYSYDTIYYLLYGSVILYQEATGRDNKHGFQASRAEPGWGKLGQAEQEGAELSQAGPD